MAQGQERIKTGISLKVGVVYFLEITDLVLLL